MAYYNLAIVILFAFNISIFLKLNFFIPQLTGNSILVDFDAYYKLLGDIKEEVNPYTVGYMQTLGPPLVFTYFLPFSFFGLQTARSLFTFINISSGFAVCFLLAKKYSPRKTGLLFLALNSALFSSFPARFSIELGQSNLIATLLATIALTQMGAHKKGVSLAALTIVKTFFAFSLLAFLKKNRKTLLVALFYLTLFFFVGSIFFKLSWYSFYVREKLPNLFLPNTKAITLTSSDYYNQTLITALSRIGLIQFAQPAYFISAVGGAVLVIFTGSLSFSLILSIILSVISWQHYFVVLFPIFVKTFSEMKKSKTNTIIFALAALFWWIEFPWLHNAKLTLLTGLLSSHYLISAFLLGFLVLITKPKTRRSLS